MELHEAKSVETRNALEKCNYTKNKRDQADVCKYEEYKVKPDPQNIVNNESEKKEICGGSGKGQDDIKGQRC